MGSGWRHCTGGKGLSEPGPDTAFHVNEHPLRGTAARIGIVLLNLIEPGLGLVRLGKLRLGATIAALSVGLGWFLTLAAAHGPTLTFRSLVIGLAIFVPLSLAIYVWAFVASWRTSRLMLPRSGQSWRWPGLLIFVAVVVLAGWPFSDGIRGEYRTFWIPSEAMVPTFMVGDRITAKMRDFGPLYRGDNVIVSARGQNFIKRIAGLPGDIVALRGGVVFISGQPVPQSPQGAIQFTGSSPPGPKSAQAFGEQFPGEQAAHAIIDSGPYPQDNFSPITLGPDQYFLLGDNRDNSADSRFPALETEGLGLVKRADIRGKVLFRYWRRGEGLKEGPP